MKYIKRLNENITREYVFTGKRNSNLVIKIVVSPNGRIESIENPSGLRFPFDIGQLFNRTMEVWACNNYYYMNGEDTCPEEKIFGMRKKDIPQGHELRYIYPNKFK